MSTKQQIISLEQQYFANNYKPLPVVFVKGRDCWLYDEQDKTYLDMMGGYSAIAQGHCHPKLVASMLDQASRLTHTSRAFHNDTQGPLGELLCGISGFDKLLMMNTGAEAFDTAVKCVRKWGKRVKGVADNHSIIIVATNNFHGRTLAATSASSEPLYFTDYDPLLPGFIWTPYGDLGQFETFMCTHGSRIVGFIIEPIQGEGGIIVPPEGYLAACYELCKKYNVLMICDEIQTGLGRTGKMFAFEHDDFRPDGIIIGKALSGGMFPVSAMLARSDVLGVFEPGTHGSTFGGSALACAVAKTAIEIILDENLVDNSKVVGQYLFEQLSTLKGDFVKDVRGKGLLLGIEIDPEIKDARTVCEALLEDNIVSKDTHGKVLRFAPPLTFTKDLVDYAMKNIARTFDRIQLPWVWRRGCK